MRDSVREPLVGIRARLQLRRPLGSSNSRSTAGNEKSDAQP